MTTISRTPKKEPHEVITYEIEMLMYCFSKLVPIQLDETYARNVYLESYLLHYRNLGEFFGARNPRPNDLTVRRSSEWSKRHLTDAEIAPVIALGELLYDACWKDISQQLQHCTHPPFERKREWPLEVMQAEIVNLLKSFIALASM